MRIFIGTQEVAGFFTNLEAGFKTLGYTVCFVNLVDQFQFRSVSTAEPRLVRLQRLALQKHRQNSRNQLIKWIISKIWLLITSTMLFFWALINFDVFIFSFGRSLFWKHADLPLLRLFGKKIIFHFLGSDCRPPYMNAVRMTTGISIEDAIIEAKMMKRRIRIINRYANEIICGIPHSHFHERPIISNAYINYALSDNLPAIDQTGFSKSDKVRVLHVPSKKDVKGTDKIEAIIKSLIQDGYPISYEIMSGVPNNEVKRALSNCDFIIDNLYTDTSIGVIGAEAAQYGKPSVIGGYVWDELKRFFPSECIPPAERCHPDDLRKSIIKLVEDKAYREDLGRRAKTWVESNWMGDKVACKMLNVIDGNVPDSWYFDPKDINYFHGHGLSDEQSKNFIRQVIEIGGIRALQLYDKPNLEDRAVAFANSGKIAQEIDKVKVI